MASRLAFDPSPRRLSRQRRRELAALLVARADALPEPDKALILEVYAAGRSVLDATRRDNPDPATLPARAGANRRRVRRLTRRMLTPTFELVRTQQPAWPPIRARVGHACFILGLSMRAASESLNLSLHTVRSHAHAIRAMAAVAAQRGRAA